MGRYLLKLILFCGGAAAVCIGFALWLPRARPSIGNQLKQIERAAARAAAETKTAEAFALSRLPPPPPPLPEIPVPPQRPVVPPRPAPRFADSVNYASVASGAAVTGGSNPQALIDGNTTQYDGGSGFAWTDWQAQPPQALVVSLKTPTRIDCISFLLWDREEPRFYRYKLEVCADDAGKEWRTVADRSSDKDVCKSWQVISLAPRVVKQIRLTGTFNNMNNGFHVVELQATLGGPNARGLDF